MSDRSENWQIAADIETLAHAIDRATSALTKINRGALAALFETIPDLSVIDDDALFRALIAKSAQYQALADAEPDGPECPSSPTRAHIVDTSMESGSNNCFHCGERMK